VPSESEAGGVLANQIARNLRQRMTAHEVRLWVRLRRLKQQGHHFRRQVPIDGYIVDFACFGSRLIVEVDGGQHALPPHAAKDAERDGHLRSQGFRVMRFWNTEIDRDIVAVVDAIVGALNNP
jgi:very-short-patch-repair endonuclease